MRVWSHEGARGTYRGLELHLNGADTTQLSIGVSASASEIGKVPPRCELPSDPTSRMRYLTYRVGSHTLNGMNESRLSRGVDHSTVNRNFTVALDKRVESAISQRHDQRPRRIHSLNG